MFFRKKKKISNFILFSVFCVFIALYFSFGLIFEKFVSDADVEHILAQKSGLSYKIDDLKLNLTFDLCAVLKMKKLLVSTPNSPVLDFNDLKIKVKILPLIFKNLSLKKFDAKEASLDLKIDENGKPEILKYLKIDEKNKFNLIFSDSDISFGKYYLNLDDLYNKNNFSLNGDFLDISDLNLKKKIALKTEGLFIRRDKKSPYKMGLLLKLPIEKHMNNKDLDITLFIHDLDLSFIEPYIKNNGIEKAAGVLDIDIKTEQTASRDNYAIDIKGDKILIKGRDFTITNPSLTKFSSNMILEKNNLEILNSSFLTRGIDISIDGIIKKITSKGGDLDLNLRFRNTEVNDILSLIPNSFDTTPEKYLINLKKYNSHAKLNGEMNFKGKTPEPQIFGKLNINDTYVVEKRPYIPYSDGIAEFLGDKFRVDITARADKGQEVYIKGEGEFYGRKYGEFKVTSTDHVDLAVTHFILCPVRDIIGFSLGPVPIMKLKGEGSIDIQTKGTLENATIDGWFKFKNTEATIEGFSDWLKNADGKIDFKGEKFEFTGWRAKLYDGDVRIFGGADTKGKTDISFDVKSLSLSNAIKISNSSDIIKKYIHGLQYIKNPKGKIDFKLNLKGELLEYTKETIMDSFKVLGSIVLKDNSVTDAVKNLELNSLNGKIDFGEKIEPDLRGKLYNSSFGIKGVILQGKNDQKVDLDLHSDKIKSDDIYKILGLQNSFLDKNNFYLASKIRVKGTLPLDLDNINLNRLNLQGYIKGVNSTDSPVKFESGMVKLDDNTAVFENFKVRYFDSSLFVKGNIKRILTEKMKPELSVSLRDFGLETLLNSLSLSKNIRISNDVSDFKGTLSGDFSVNGENFKGQIEPKGVSFYIKPKKCYLTMKSGNIFLDNNNLKLKAFNILLDKTPLYFDSNIKHFLSKRPQIEAKFSSNIDSGTLDKFVNTNLSYPVKLSGETMLSGTLKGYSDNYTIDSNLILNEGNDLEYMGANFGDVESKRQISANITFMKNIAKINRAKYEKFVVSQNNKSNPLLMLQAQGAITIGKDDVYFKNLRLKTLNSITAKVFNLAFKKSILKKGLFDCDLMMNGSSKNLNLDGRAELRDLNIPLYDLEVLGANLDFNKDTMEGEFKLKSYNSDVLIRAKAKNNFNLPVVIKDVDIKSDTISLNKILEGFSQTSKVQASVGNGTNQNIVLNPKDIVIEHGTIDAKQVFLDDISAKNLTGEFLQDKDGIFKVKDITFDIAGGKIKSKGSFDYSKVSLDLNSKIENCDSDVLVSSVLKMPGQLYGKMNGSITFSGKNLNTKESINTIKSKADFEILDGKMPKLGSLEYLLRAGNFYKSGILGFTLNNLINVLNPYKTGEFKSIKGHISVHDGFMDNIEIYSAGENLSIFLNGNYDLIKNDADIVVFGRLSKNVSSVLGVVGNASLNSVLNTFALKDKSASDSALIQNINKIPLIEISNDDFRFFSARIKGDLNKDNYVKVFNWLN